MFISYAYKLFMKYQDLFYNMVVTWILLTWFSEETMQKFNLESSFRTQNDVNSQRKMQETVQPI